ncbi:hypothetical protein [Methylobacter sp. BBA5.1]|uniref:hypothetical protein n=1 Tax=Methylobacter sp. BBA5.1 TaxID=1495064 RepID=UPI000565572C|nr:hypothetical protein [Methylobacter sp. BBA5.1]
MQHPQEHEERILLATREFAKSINSGRKVVADMSSLVDATSRLSLSNLDYWERLIRWEFSEVLRSSTPSKWKPWTQSTPFLTWIDLCSGDGFKREKTLCSLSGAAPNSFFFALAVRRLNDWVRQVREAAQEKLPIIAKESDPEHVVDALCVTLPHWNSWGRLEDADKRVLLEITSIEEVSQALKLRIMSATSGPMTSMLAQVGRTATLDHCLSEIAEDAIQPSVRAKAYRCLFEGKMVWFEGRKWEWTDIRYCEGRLKPVLSERNLSVTSPFLETLKKAAVDHSPMVRRVAGEMLIRELKTIGEESLKLANLLASDSSPSVSERGKFALKKLETQEA